ncbi:MAG: bifunctional (p)ppGpp synthetase/guanosine-3',5'-bis(diphosphate) 3'-pyrophosphohydrolase [Synergistaceae bacterium]|nr:bifunctional (p)ppGpp synthetase/guanosine-3',5'-bis(diphosphate) 3'-pyrophosphohydrolase [Synergistaceae bacterium]
MFYSELVNKAIDLAYEAHHGQRDKTGRPYFVHVMHVAEQMDDEYSACAALLHDTLEDTHIGLERLEREFPREVVEAVKALTKRRGVSYSEYIEGVRRNPIARKVKLADLEHNLDVRRLAGCEDRLLYGYERRKGKYEAAREILRRSEDL